jgi:hypothetical protein
MPSLAVPLPVSRLSDRSIAPSARHEVFARLW